MNIQDIPTDQLGSITLFDEEAKELKMNSLWQEKTAVLIFIRHFG